MRTKREQEQRLAQWFMAESGRQWDTADESERQTCTSLAQKLIKAGYGEIAEYEAEIDRLIGTVAELNTKIDGCVKRTDDSVELPQDDSFDVARYFLQNIRRNFLFGMLLPRRDEEDEDNERD